MGVTKLKQNGRTFIKLTDLIKYIISGTMKIIETDIKLNMKRDILGIKSRNNLIINTNMITLNQSTRI